MGGSHASSYLGFIEIAVEDRKMKKFLVLASALAALIPAAAYAAEKPEIVLVHGAFEDSSVWKGVEASLRKDGYHTLAINLPGRTTNPRSPDQISLADYTGAVLKGVAHARRPVVLVGHSFGGIVISQFAELAPEKIRTLVYVAAYLPRDGASLLSLATSDKDSAVGPHLQIEKDKGLASIEYGARADLFANDGTDALKAVIPALILDEPLAPLAQPVHLTAAFSGVNKTYVFTEQDHVVSPALQHAMVAATPVSRSFSLHTGHTPFLTDVSGLVQAIEASAQ
jgi:pimeloyl-ACP methyl ester carboxylesterase